MSKKFDFKKQLNTGDAGEEKFKIHYQSLEPIKSLEDRSYDFKLATGETVELKTDTYPMEKTPNFFMEYFSDNKSLKKGGPWRALDDSVDYFVYFFINDSTFYWFNTKALVKALEDYIALNNPKTKTVANRGWITEGYAIPRDALEKFLIKKEIF